MDENQRKVELENNVEQDDIMNAANAFMKNKRLLYGVEYVDDYRMEKEEFCSTPASLIAKIGCGKILLRPRKATPFDLYRLGARIIYSQTHKGS